MAITKADESHMLPQGKVIHLKHLHVTIEGLHPLSQVLVKYQPTGYVICVRKVKIGKTN